MNKYALYTWDGTEWAFTCFFTANSDQEAKVFAEEREARGHWCAVCPARGVAEEK